MFDAVSRTADAIGVITIHIYTCFQRLNGYFDDCWRTYVSHSMGLLAKLEQAQLRAPWNRLLIERIVWLCDGILKGKHYRDG
jgi:hypothetical protein